MPFAGNTDTVHETAEPIPAVNPQARARSDAHVSYELMHQRLGHRSHRAIAAGHAAQVWKGIKLYSAPEDYCVSCKIAATPKASRGHSACVNGRESSQSDSLSVASETKRNIVLFLQQGLARFVNWAD